MIIGEDKGQRYGVWMTRETLKKLKTMLKSYKYITIGKIVRLGIDLAFKEYRNDPNGELFKKYKYVTEGVPDGRGGYRERVESTDGSDGASE